MSVLYPLKNENMVSYALSLKLVNIIAHIEDEKKELAKKAYQLDHLVVRLSSFNKDSSLFQNGWESSLVVDAKAKQDIHPNLVP